MKLLEKLVENTINKSPILAKAVDLMEAMVKETRDLKLAIGFLAHQVQTHHNAILDLYAKQGIILKALKSNTMDMKMPDGTDKEKAPKPN